MNKHAPLLKRMTEKLDAIPDDLRGRPNDVFREYEEARDLLQLYGDALVRISESSGHILCDDTGVKEWIIAAEYARTTIEQEKDDG